MATLLFQRARWSIEIARTTRRYTINIQANIPRRFDARSTQINPSPSQTLRSWQAHQRRPATTVNRTLPTDPEPLPQTERNAPPAEPLSDLTQGFNDTPATIDPVKQQDWATSFHGLAAEPFSKEINDVLLAPLEAQDVEVKPDGILYLPEIKYRRILNKAFGPGGWGLAPRGETIVTPKAVTREYGLLALGRLVSVARGEQDYFSPEGIPTAAEGCKSNALTRCCKDLGIASELWDPRFIRKYLADHVKDIWVEHVVTKKKKKIYIRKDDKVGYPWKESKMGSTYS